MIPQPTPKQAEFHRASRAFHAKIAAKAAELRPAAPRTYSIPNAPYGTPKKGVRVIRSSRYVQPKEFTIAYDEAWSLEICGIEPSVDPFSSRLLMDRIKRTVAAFYQVSLGDLLSDRRTKALVIPRHLAMYLCKVMTPRSLPDIGRAFGDRDHTTILNAVRNTEARMRRDLQFAGIVDVLRSQCGGGKK